MPTPANNFLPFSIDVGHDETAQSDYASATWRQQGWRSGILPHQQINKAIRQSSVIAAAFAQTVADLTQTDVLDDGNLTALTNQIKTAFSAYLPYNAATVYPPGSIGYSIQNGLSSGSLTADALRSILTGSLTSAEFSSIINGRLNLIDAPITGLVTKVADLTAAYGSAVSAADSAANALVAAIGAVNAQNLAAVSAGAALTSETNSAASATTASTAASNAGVSASNAAASQTSAAGSASTASSAASTATSAASAASGYATSAAISATAASSSSSAAGSAATSASNSATTASTQAANASTYASNASGSATTASAAAATATTKAGLAAASEGNAANSASAAATSATTAGTNATNASNSANLAATQALNAATQAANASNAATAAAGSASSAQSFSNAAGSNASAAQNSAVSASASASSAQSALGQVARSNLVARARSPDQTVDLTWGVSGWGFRAVGGQVPTGIFGRVNLAPLTPGVSYTVSFRARLTSGVPFSMDVSFQPLTIIQYVSRTVQVVDSQYSWVNVSSASGDWATAMLQFSSGSLPVGTTIEITDIKVEQNTVVTPFVSNPQDVQYYALAAATSSATATAQASAASTSASAAQSARLAAESASGAASSSATQAANSVTTAQGAASTAQSQATTAVSAANNASGYATSANTSSINANASAGSAAGSASAALSYYNNTVSATGSLSAQVTQETSTRASQVSGLQAQLVFKTVATRSDGSRVIGAIGLASTAPNDATGGQSLILLQADKLVFVPSSDPNATILQPFVVGSVDGVSSLVVGQAAIGDNTILPRSIFTPNLSAISALLGNVRIDANGSIIQGMTSYGVGSGVFIGQNAGEYSILIGDKTGGSYIEYKPSFGQVHVVNPSTAGVLQFIGTYVGTSYSHPSSGNPSSTGTISFHSDGTIWTTSTNFAGVTSSAKTGDWYLPTTAGIGSQYQLLAIKTQGPAGTGTSPTTATVSGVGLTGLSSNVNLSLAYTDTTSYDVSASGNYAIVQVSSGQQKGGGTWSLEVSGDPAGTIP